MLEVLRGHAEDVEAFREAFNAEAKARMESRAPRPRLKVDAAIANAGTILELRRSHGSFAAWIHEHHPLTKTEWVKLFKKTFRFTGGEITGEFLMSIGYLPGAHHEACPVYEEIAALIETPTIPPSASRCR